MFDGLQILEWIVPVRGLLCAATVPYLPLIVVYPNHDNTTYNDPEKIFDRGNWVSPPLPLVQHPVQIQDMPELLFCALSEKGCVLQFDKLQLANTKICQIGTHRKQANRLQIDTVHSGQCSPALHPKPRHS